MNDEALYTHSQDHLATLLAVPAKARDLLLLLLLQEEKAFSYTRLVTEAAMVRPDLPPASALV